MEQSIRLTLWPAYFFLPLGLGLMAALIALKLVCRVLGKPEPEPVALIALRVLIGVTLIAVSYAGIAAIGGHSAAWGILQVVPYSFISNWTLSSVPMFLLMGFVCYHCGLTRGLFDAARVWLSRLPGGLAIAAVFGCTGFAAVTGSRVACAAAMGKIAVPEMVRHKYDIRLATGTLGLLLAIGPACRRVSSMKTTSRWRTVRSASWCSGPVNHGSSIAAIGEIRNTRPKPGATLEPANLLEFLKPRLPAYMRPRYIEKRAPNRGGLVPVAGDFLRHVLPQGRGCLEIEPLAEGRAHFLEDVQNSLGFHPFRDHLFVQAFRDIA